MGREVLDHEGGPWAVSRVIDTAHGFSIYCGRPAGEKGGRGSGVSTRTVILTPELAAHLALHRRSNIAAHELPIGSNTVKKLRKELGFNRYDDAAAWWEERSDDLRNLTLEAFAAKHGRKVSAVERARLQLFGKTNRDNGWWLDGAVREAVTADRPAAEVAAGLGVAEGTVRKLRTLLKRLGFAVPTDHRERIARSKRGKPAHPKTAEALRLAATRKKSEPHRAAIAAALRAYRARRAEGDQ